MRSILIKIAEGIDAEARRITEWSQRFEELEIPPDFEERGGECFLLVGNEIIRLRPTERADNLRLVHGYIEDIFGNGLDHAWIEDVGENKIWEPRYDKWFEKEDFEFLFNPTVYHSYTPKEACKWMVDTEHYGPWE